MRTVSWGLEAAGISGQTTATTDAFDLLQDLRTELGTNHLMRYTITRMIGDIYFRADTIPTLDNVQEVSFGIGIFNENLTDVNHPNPRTENANWMWQKTILWVPWTVESSAGVFRQLQQVVSFDIRTQRILRGTEDRLELVIANTGSEDVSSNWRLRTLVRHP